MAARWPAYFVAFDVLQLDGQELLNRLYKERRALLERLFTDRALTAPWTLCPMTTDLAEAREWLQTWTDVSGVEGIVVKPLSSRYLPVHTRGGPRSEDGTPPKRSSAPSPEP
ncbi:ATP-dependent DNA ligase [Streptomyces vinaceus]|uniref:ATP-dependent DNA ligase n=1 Tax=Streptomyces vinaceus TaxID=1960 RepID=UPI003820ADA1